MTVRVSDSAKATASGLPCPVSAHALFPRLPAQVDAAPCQRQSPENSRLGVNPRALHWNLHTCA